MTIPIFVKLDDYEKTLALISQSEENIDMTKKLLEKLEETKNKELEEIKVINEELKEVEEKINVLKQKLQNPN